MGFCVSSGPLLQVPKSADADSKDSLTRISLLTTHLDIHYYYPHPGYRVTLTTDPPEEGARAKPLPETAVSGLTIAALRYCPYPCRPVSTAHGPLLFGNPDVSSGPIPLRRRFLIL